MVTLPPRHYCRIGNPVVRDAKSGQLEIDTHGQVRIRWGDEEIRFEQPPFPLYPGETLKEKPTALAVVPVNTALRIRATRDFVDAASKVARVAGDEWLFMGPDTYTPRIEETVVQTVSSIIIKENEALRICATMDCQDWKGVPRVAGEQWTVFTTGAYMPNVCEDVVGTVKAFVLTPKSALHVQAIETHKDVFGREHRAGDEWLVTMADCETYIPETTQTVRGKVKITTLTNRQFCIVHDPLDPATGRTRLGMRELRKGECSFFLHPGERLERGIQDIYVLSEGEALLLRATEAVTIDKVARKPGDRWMIYGPTEFTPDVAVDVVERRRTIPLDENEGIYVRDTATGKIRTVIGASYMLKPHEELYPKRLLPEVEELLMREASRDAKEDDRALRAGGEAARAAAAARPARDPTRVVTYRVPNGAVVQVYDYEKKRSRVVFGPDIVLLEPDEFFTTLTLSRGVPKTETRQPTIALFLGPDFMADIIVVETADHARLSLHLAYSWYFDVSRDRPEEAHAIFHTPDFVGDLCKALGSRVRGAVASRTFDEFHKHSVEIIQEAMFGREGEDDEEDDAAPAEAAPEKGAKGGKGKLKLGSEADAASASGSGTRGKLRDRLVFPATRLVVNSVDIQSVEPVDQKTRDSLQKSVQLAIEITSQSQEASARHEAERLEQQSKGELERQRLADQGEAERARKGLLELQAKSAEVECAGQAVAEARAIAEAAKIEGEAALRRADLEAKSATITAEAQLAEEQARHAVALEHQQRLAELEISKKRQLAEIEATKFAELVDAIGPDTIQAIARAGPEMQSKLLGSLGLNSVMITDGNSPINIFNTAGGLIGAVPTTAPE